MPYSRKRSRSRSVDFSRVAKTARRTGTISTVSRARRSRAYMKLRPLASRVNSLYKMIETKESSRTGTPDLALAHNDVTIFGTWNDKNIPHTLTTACNPFSLAAQGTDDPMSGPGSRVGDSINVKGLLIQGFFENALGRPKVYYRVMLIRTAKGEVPTRSVIFKGASNNKMIDQINRERCTVVAQKIFNIGPSSAITVSLNSTTGQPGGGDVAMTNGIATRTFKMWIPGSKFGRNGLITYENASTSQVKFYDYRICILAYDWFGTPQDVNAVGRVNEMYTKLYFKDA